MSVLQRVNSSFNNQNLPATVVGEIFNAGTLYCFDPTHPWAPWTNGVANSGSIPNAAYRSAKALNPTTPEPLLQGTLISSGISGFQTASGLVERTPKGGFHPIVASAATQASTYSFLRANTGISNYLYAYRDHDIYFSVWNRITRSVADTEFRAAFAISAGQNRDAEYLMALQSGGDLPGVGANRLGADSTNKAAVGPSLRAITTRGMTGTFANLIDTVPFIAGRGLSWQQGSNITKQTPSHIWYRSYCEDLTVSGRTHAQAYAADLALYTREVLTVGGRYYGDTYTAPF